MLTFLKRLSSNTAPSQKCLRAIALAQLADEGVVQLDESINSYLLEEVQDPKWEGVTFEQLATHSAGLPLSPPNMTFLFNLRYGNDAYAKYGEAMLYEAMKKVELQTAGEFNEYSNFSFGLLGTLLADITGSSYADLINTRIFTPSRDEQCNGGRLEFRITLLNR